MSYENKPIVETPTKVDPYATINNPINQSDFNEPYQQQPIPEQQPVPAESISPTEEYNQQPVPEQQSVPAESISPTEEYKPETIIEPITPEEIHDDDTDSVISDTAYLYKDGILDCSEVDKLITTITNDFNNKFEKKEYKIKYDPENDFKLKDGTIYTYLIDDMLTKQFGYLYDTTNQTFTIKLVCYKIDTTTKYPYLKFLLKNNSFIEYSYKSNLLETLDKDEYDIHSDFITSLNSELEKIITEKKSGGFNPQNPYLPVEQPPTYTPVGQPNPYGTTGQPPNPYETTGQPNPYGTTGQPSPYGTTEQTPTYTPVEQPSPYGTTEQTPAYDTSQYDTTSESSPYDKTISSSEQVQPTSDSINIDTMFRGIIPYYPNNTIYVILNFTNMNSVPKGCKWNTVSEIEQTNNMPLVQNFFTENLYMKILHTAYLTPVPTPKIMYLCKGNESNQYENIKLSDTNKINYVIPRTFISKKGNYFLFSKIPILSTDKSEDLVKALVFIDENNKINILSESTFGFGTSSFESPYIFNTFTNQNTEYVFVKPFDSFLLLQE